MFLEKGIIFLLDRKKEKKTKNLGWWSIELLQEEEAFQQKILQVYDGFSYINKVMFQDFFYYYLGKMMELVGFFLQ